MPDPPPLSRLSDFTFLAWQAACNGNRGCISKLNWIIHTLVVNLESEEIAQDVTGQQDSWPDWRYKKSMKRAQRNTSLPLEVRMDWGSLLRSVSIVLRRWGESMWKRLLCLA